MKSLEELEAVIATSDLFLIPTPSLLPTDEPQYMPITNLIIYEHPDKLFRLNVPEGWSESLNENGSSFEDPDGSGVIDFNVVNTIYNLDQEDYQNFIQAREKNIFSRQKDFIEVDRKVDYETGIVIINKELFKSENNLFVKSYYLQQGRTVSILDFWADSNDSERYRSFLTMLIDSIRIGLPRDTELEYTYKEDVIEYVFSGIHIRVPSYWSYDHLSGEYSEVHTFSSPDQRALIQVVFYKDGQILNKSLAGKFVLNVLREQYTHGITIQSDSVRDDLREQLTWKAKNSNYEGITIFDTNENALRMVTIIWETDFNSYQELLNSVIDDMDILPTIGE